MVGGGIGVLVGGGTRVEVAVGLGRRVFVGGTRVEVGDEVKVGEAGTDVSVKKSVGVDSMLMDYRLHSQRRNCVQVGNGHVHDAGGFKNNGVGMGQDWILQWRM